MTHFFIGADYASSKITSPTGWVIIRCIVSVTCLTLSVIFFWQARRLRSLRWTVSGLILAVLALVLYVTGWPIFERSLLFLLCGAFSFACFWQAISDRKKFVGQARRLHSLRLTATGLILAVLAWVFYVTGAAPFLKSEKQEKLAKAEQVTAKTIREKVGKEPDRITFKDSDFEFISGGWRYRGTAQTGDTIWDVTVTRSESPDSKTERIDCEVAPRR